MKIYHNPRCTKSRQCLALIREAGVEPEIIEYLHDIPTASELKALISKLNIRPEELVRKGEAEYKQLYKGKKLSDDEWIAAMLAHPKLIERPIVVKGNKAMLGRPPENVLKLLPASS